MDGKESNLMLNRRQVLVGGMVAGASLVGLKSLMARTELGATELSREAAQAKGGYGPLTKKRSKNTGDLILSLPEGFEYTVFGRTGDKMSDGRATPGLHDGMAAFQVGDEIRLVRNHEVRSQPGTSIAPADVSYDPTAGGGTTTLVVDPKTRELVRDWVSLSGTLVNCAGGPTPWGSWITCEETVAGQNVGQVYHKDDRKVGGYQKPHGYCFDVPADSDGPVKPVALHEMGRFVHEAIAIDPKTGIVYETEDEGQAGFYRFIPNEKGNMAKGGKLQMMRVVGKDRFDTRTDQKVLKPMKVEWVDIKNPDPSDAGTVKQPVFNEGLGNGCATFARLEGCWYGDGYIYLNSTNGGDKKLGQIWRYEPLPDGNGELVLLYESKSVQELDAPDNICVSPRGGLVICEDGDGQNKLRGLTRDGKIFEFAANEMNDSELAGSCFSPDGKTLFVNIQSPGLTLAIWGPWEKGAL